MAQFMMGDESLLLSRFDRATSHIIFAPNLKWSYSITKRYDHKILRNFLDEVLRREDLFTVSDYTGLLIRRDTQALDIKIERARRLATVKDCRKSVKSQVRSDAYLLIMRHHQAAADIIAMPLREMQKIIAMSMSCPALNWITLRQVVAEDIDLELVGSLFEGRGAM